MGLLLQLEFYIPIQSSHNTILNSLWSLFDGNSILYNMDSDNPIDQPADHCFILRDKQENMKSYPNYREPL